MMYSCTRMATVGVKGLTTFIGVPGQTGAPQRSQAFREICFGRCGVRADILGG